MPKIILSKPSDEVRQKRIKLIHVPAVLFKLTGVRRTRKCIYNWMMTGKRVYTGKDKRAILGHEKIMGEYYTTRGDIESFLVEIAK